MSHSFGEGYATRCDEEGFGGIYGGKQSMPKTDECIHENHPGLVFLSDMHVYTFASYFVLFVLIFSFFCLVCICMKLMTRRREAR